MTNKNIKIEICKAIDEHRDELYQIGLEIYKNPELGFKEFATSQLVKDTFDKIGLQYEQELVFTGIKAKLKNENQPGPNIAIMGELDAVMCPTHPEANKDTGAAHCCGHFAQVTSMLGAAFGLSAVKDKVDYGNVTFFAIPAEECVELEWRQELIKEGKINYLGGKQELIRQGYFDDVDMAMMVHGKNTDGTITATNKMVGFLAKNITFHGVEAHAGLYPWDGVNALNAASLALMAINSIRETLKDEDCIRIHPIITKGGDLVNTVPCEVRMETYIRGASIEAIKDANAKVNRALKGCAYAIGAEVEILDTTGYLPLNQDQNLAQVFEANSKVVCPDTPVIHVPQIEGASSDIGDLGTVMPVLHAGIGGFVNNFHSKDFKLDDMESAFIIPAKIMACCIVDLLCDSGEKAKYILDNYDRKFNISDYDKIWEDIMSFEL